ncbi:MAG TPA: GNAT family N-acetyltransferase [Gemmataceae bacterium]|nr:GNAT family N-acetyltransferase [Gemmataceae bacterium]
MAFTIRRAVPADAPTIVEFNRLMAQESEGKTLDANILGRGVANALADPNKALYYLALQQDEIVGQLSLTFEWSDWRNGWLWWIQSVYVKPEWRRSGVFRSLYEYVYQAAQADPDVIGLRLYVEKENLGAQQTYLSVGMDWANYLILERYPL